MTPPELPVQKRRIRRITPLQAGKICACLYGIMGLLMIPFFLIMSVAASQMPKTAGAPPAGMFAAMGLGMAVALPILYGGLGFVIGALGALVYNLLAGWIGGIEVEVE